MLKLETKKLCLTEHQLGYLRALVTKDECDQNGLVEELEAMSQQEYSDLIDGLNEAHKAFHGPGDDAK